MKAITLFSWALAPIALASAATQTTTIMSTQTTTVIYTVIDSHPTSMSLYPLSISSATPSYYNAANGTASAAPSGSAPAASASTVASATTPGSSIQPSISPVKGAASTMRAGFGLAAAAVVAAVFL